MDAGADATGVQPQQSLRADVRDHVIQNVIQVVRSRISEPWTTDTMAKVANYSVYHFIRMFVDTVGVPPRRYLMAVRIDLAKAELVHTDRSVRDICISLGYTSVGTFTSQFTRLVGLSPNQLRRHQRSPGRSGTARRPAGAGGTVRGCVSGPTTNAVAVGLFRDPLPAGQPVSCALLERPGRYTIDAVPPGRYFVHAAAIEPAPARSAPGTPRPQAPRTRAAAAPRPWSHVGSAAEAIEVDGAGHASSADVALRPTRPTDPPILVMVPT